MFQDFQEDNKNDDFLNEFRQKIANQSLDSFEEKRSELNHSKNVFIGAVSGIALAAVVGWFVLSPRYKSASIEEIPVIRRPQAAIKEQPANPGGMEILNQDKTVYDIIEKKAGDSQVIESVLPPPEEPKVIEVAESKVEEADETVKQAEKIMEKASDVKVVDETTATVSVVEPVSETETVKEVVEDKTQVVIKDRPAIEQEKPAPAPQKAVQIDDPAQKIFDLRKANEEKVITLTDVVLENKTPKAVTASDSEFDADIKSNGIPSGSWQIQLMSSPNKKAVEGAWKTLVKKHDVLENQPYELETANLGEKGTYYRLRAGAFKNKSDADTLCNDVKATGGTCIVNRKK